MWAKEKFFKYSVGIILILLIIFLFGQINYVFEPIKEFVSIIFMPILLAGFLYYLLRPLVHLLEKLKIKRSFAILIVFVFVIGVFSLLGSYAGSLISKQFNQLTSNLPKMIEDGINEGAKIIKKNNLDALLDTKMQEQLTSTLKDLVPKITGSLSGILSTVTGVATVLIMSPFILFYLLKDDRLFVTMFLDKIPKKMREETKAILKETDKTISIYIIGQALLAMILGSLMYIGYLIIGMPYPLILAIFATLTSFIPMFGSAIGLTPALIIGLAIDPMMAVKVIIIAVIINQLEGNLISPFLVGKRLDIHPLTLIILFLVAASSFGFVGMLIGVPVYAVLRVLIKNTIRIYRLKKPKNPVIQKE